MFVGLAGFVLMIGSSAQLPSSNAAVPRPPAERGDERRLMPPLETIALPEERATVTKLLSLQAAIKGDHVAALAAFDAALATLTRPSQLRGAVQLTRASLLVGMERVAEATLASEEAIRLLPGYSAPLLMAFQLYGFSARPDKSADALMRAIAIDPASARDIDDYDINNLVMRLDLARDTRRSREVVDKLLAIGWMGDGVASRSALAHDAIKARIRAGDIAGARALIPSLVAPADTRTLLMMNVNRAIWSDLEAWAGATMEKQWPGYLRESRDRWVTSGDLSLGRQYMTALSSAGLDREMVDEFEPVVARVSDPERDWAAMFMAPILAGAQVRLGKVSEAQATFDQLGAIWPLGSSAIALNIWANRGRWLIFTGRPAEGLAQLDAAVADTRKWGGEVNVDALRAMHHYRACALHLLGRDDEARVAAAIATAEGKVENAAEAYLCIGDMDTARNRLIAALAQEDERESVVAFMQLQKSDELETDFIKADRERRDALRRDPRLLAAIAPYGRVLPFALNGRVNPIPARP